MPLLKFNIRWDDDINVERDVEILHSQTFYQFHEIIKQSFVFPPEMEAIIYVSNDKWRKSQAVSSAVEKNIRGAEALSMIKTPIGALLKEQHQKFIYSALHKKNWGLLIELISMSPDPIDISQYPKCTRQEGVSPATFGAQTKEPDPINEIEEKFDIEDMLNDDVLDDELLDLDIEADGQEE